MKLSDNTVLVTGGGSGIDLALAKALTLRGNTVVVCDRNAQKLEAVCKENPIIVTFLCNIASDRDVLKLISQRFVKLCMAAFVAQ